MTQDRIFERVSLGLLALGTIEREPNGWIARGPDWQSLGRFETWQDALDQIWVAHIANPTLALICTPAALH